MLIKAARSGSDLVRCRSATSSSPSHDNGFTIVGKAAVDCAAFLFQALLPPFNKSSSETGSDFPSEPLGVAAEEIFLIFRDRNGSLEEDEACREISSAVTVVMVDSVSVVEVGCNRVVKGSWDSEWNCSPIC